ncbi:MAG: sulfite exporter TauE/SafE family protein [Pseudolabrys sp.]
MAGFAMGLVVSGVYLHILTPIQTATLIVGYGFATQGYGVWALRHSVRWRSALPFIAGGLFGVPAGTILLTYIDPDYMRVGVGALLVLYSIYSLARPALKIEHEGIPAEVTVGFLNGMVCGLTGLVGIVVVIWCQLRSWPKDIQRAVFQPVMLATVLTTTVSFAVAGAVTIETMKLYLIGLPCMLAGTWIGLKLYGKVDDAGFRKIVLLMLLVFGLSLIVPMSIFR